MVLPLIAAAATVGGAGVSWYGQHQQQQAMQEALDRYRQNTTQFNAENADVNAQYRQGYDDLSNQRLGAIGHTLDGYMAPGYGGRQAGDTATLDSSVAAARGVNPNGVTTPTSGWGERAGERGMAALGRQRVASGDANQLARVGLAQNLALNDFATQDSSLGRQTHNLQQSEALRRAVLAQRQQELERDSQGDMAGAQKAGASWLQAGGYIGSLGGLLGSVPAQSEPKKKKPAGQPPTAPAAPYDYGDDTYDYGD